MHDCNTKFLNEEINPFGGLSLFFKLLENAIPRSGLDKAVCRFKVSIGVASRSNSYWVCMQMHSMVWCDAGCFGHLDMVLMTQHYISSWLGTWGWP